MEVELQPFDGPVVADMQSLVADRDLLDLALRRLGPEQRAVIVLHYYLGMPLPDVAATLRIPIGTAMVFSSLAVQDMTGTTLDAATLV